MNICNIDTKCYEMKFLELHDETFFISHSELEPLKYYDSFRDSRVEDDYKIQEDNIMKLVDDDSPKTQSAKSTEPSNSSNIQPPPNLAPPVQDQWFYQDPQGQMQGPFTSAEMAEWYKVS